MFVEARQTKWRKYCRTLILNICYTKVDKRFQANIFCLNYHHTDHGLFTSLDSSFLPCKLLFMMIRVMFNNVNLLEVYSMNFFGRGEYQSEKTL